MEKFVFIVVVLFIGDEMAFWIHTKVLFIYLYLLIFFVNVCLVPGYFFQWSEKKFIVLPFA